MSSPRTILTRGLMLGLLAAVLVAGGFLAYVTWYTRTDRLLPGVHIGQTPVGGLARREAAQRLASGALRRPPVLAGGSGAAGGAPVEGAALTGAAPDGSADPALPPEPAPPVLELRAADRTWLLDREQFGPVPDLQAALGEALKIGRQGPLLQRARSYLLGLVHGFYVPVQAHLPEAAIRARLEAIAPEVARAPSNASYDFATDTLTPDRDGQELDIEASLEAVRKAISLQEPAADLAVRPVKAAILAQDLAHSRRYQVSRFTTPILSADAGRVHNISMAVRKISGLLLRPGQVFSFNQVVGPRDKANGWAQAKELYQGEFVLGYGGGICQVSSTLYNSVLLAGLEVKERYHHDRPLSYVRPGRDATVAWNLLDFRFRNNQEVPLLVGARILPGQPQQIEVTLHAPRPLQGGPITIEEADVKYLPPTMVEVLDEKLPAGEREVIDEGHYGIDLKIYRLFGTGSRQRRELVSHDRYQPKAGKVLVGVGNAPGTERLLDPGLQ
ncbi:MAG: VanW family protein [Bacillota bacterium]